MALPTLKHAILKKSHTCEEGGAPLRSSVWHLLMNLRNNDLLVYQKSWWYDLQFLRYRVCQTEIGNYGSDTEWDRQNFLSYWAIFWLFTPLTAREIKILKKRKRCLEISSFCTCIPKIMITWCTVPEIWCATDRQTDRRTEKVT